MDVMSRLAAVRDWLVTPTCVLCGEPIHRGRDFCDACARSLPWLVAACAVCATPLPDRSDDLICGYCQQHPPRYRCVRAPFRYAAPVDRMIQGAKYNARFDWLALLGRRVAEHVHDRAREVDAILAVPLHGARLRARGYNQSQELARPLAKRLGLPLFTGVERIRATPPQTALSREDRRRNVRAAFAARREFSGLRMALVDDVMTSGATVDAVARCLRRAGAVSVEVWVAARA